jgi:hypothetical protein
MVTTMVWLAIVIFLVVPLGLAWWKRTDTDWRPFLPGIVATGCGVALSISAYEWVFETAQCNGHSDVPCVLNSNQGLLTVLTVILAVAALWVTLLVRELDRRAERRAARQKAKVALEEAADEWAHNLIHIAIASDDRGALEYGTQVSVDHTDRLFDPEIAALLGEKIMRRSDRLRRTYERMLGDDEEDAQAGLEGFVNNSMRLLLLARSSHGDWCTSVLERHGMQDFRHVAKGRSYLTFRSSEANEEAPRLRREEIPVFCWIDDDCPHGLNVFAQLGRFQDMNHPAHD